MKNLILISALILSSGLSFGQDQKKSTKPSSSKERRDNDCMLNVSYDTPLGIEGHEKASKMITHPQTDFIQFNENGTYTERIDGKTCTGTWGYNYDSHTVTVNCNGVRSYKVSRSGKKIELSSPSEKIKLVPKP